MEKNNLTARRSVHETRLLRSFQFTLVAILVLAAALFVFAVPAYAQQITVEPIKNSIYNISDILKGFALPITTIMFVVSGLALMAGQQARQWAKPTMFYTALGMMVVMFASAIAEMLQSSFGGM